MNKEKANHTINVICGVFGGIFALKALYILWDYRMNPATYAAQSAPWYTEVLVNGFYTVLILIVALIIKAIINKKPSSKDGEQ